MKYLFELVYTNKKTKNGKPSNYWNPEKRAIYCNNCGGIYGLELENNLKKIEKEILDMRKNVSEKYKI